MEIKLHTMLQLSVLYLVIITFQFRLQIFLTVLDDYGIAKER